MKHHIIIMMNKMMLLYVITTKNICNNNERYKTTTNWVPYEMSKFWIYPTYLLVENLVNYSNKWRPPTLEVEKSPIVVIDLKIAVGCQEQPRTSGTCTTNKRLRGGNQQIHVFFWEFLGKKQIKHCTSVRVPIEGEGTPDISVFLQFVFIAIYFEQGRKLICLFAFDHTQNN